MDRGRADPDFPPQALREYALLADGERGALIGPRGDIVWMCAPRWDRDAVLGALIGGPGVYAVTPGGRFVWGGHYEDGTLMWRSRWVTEDGVVECREALAFPGDPHRAVLLRRIVAVDAPARVKVVFAAAAGFADRLAPTPTRDEDGRWNTRIGELRLRWSGAGRARPDENGRLVLDLRLTAGERHDLVLEIGDGPPPAPVDPDRAWHDTARAWAEAVPRLEDTLAPRDARHAYAVMRGLTASTGGMVAAATTSLPERAEAGRNYDYRYVWIRDQCYAGQAVAAAGGHPLLDDAVRFVGARLHEHGPGLRPAYTAAGGPIQDQRRLDLPGYPGGYDLVGNRVNGQFQLDAFGEALLLFGAAADHDRLDAPTRAAAHVAAKAIAERWHEPDAGIWELAPRAWTHSRLACAAGLRATAAHLPDPDAWRRLADTIVTHTAAHNLHPDGRWKRSPDDGTSDAALLLPPLRGALAAADPRTRATLDAYRAELTDDHYAYRFRHDGRPLAEAEGAFLLCGFLMALAEHQQGHDVEAHRWFERNRAACGPPGLFSEEYDVTQRQLRGNLPQAFVHALMLESAARLTKPRPAHKPRPTPKPRPVQGKRS
ncbi:glycoside hydrolase family 15 protein [Streptomyces sp. SID3343]|uniref:glycoside hydrolase family 15 protein n=1 Tax=Streptomyces sp. SID3343 TaxID=2690260 RepID=UPI00136D98EF|nr:glycoside hydrolase family 15 protein [Streptomyces sp. SID3343]MYW03565.1 glycoside hydrolase family 15 protein [Streptomyces sp. SID3343]